MSSELYIVILNDGESDSVVAPNGGTGTREDAEESVEFWNRIEGWTATIGLAKPLT